MYIGSENIFSMYINGGSWSADGRRVITFSLIKNVEIEQQPFSYWDCYLFQNDMR